jgi:hypothetical protein
MTRWIGGLSMRQRIALGGAGVAAVLGLLLLWIGTVAKPVSAMEKMAESIRKAKSYKCISTVGSTKDFPEPGEPGVRKLGVMTQYALASGANDDLWSTRLETSSVNWTEAGPSSMTIRPAGRPGIVIDHRRKTFQRLPALQDAVLKSASNSESLENLGRFSGEADRQLGTKEIGGTEARGFQIDYKKICPTSTPGKVEFWLDAKSNLPVLLRYEIKGILSTASVEISDIQWNIDLDPKLFDPTPPAGYVDATTKPLPLEEQVRRIADALRIYAEVSGGRYPARKRDYQLDAGYELYTMMVGPTKAEPAMAKLKELFKAKAGFSEIDHIVWYSADAAYYGNTVGPKDKDKVLLRWKLDDGKYEAIFGDLRSETVTAQRLRALEGG